MQRLLAFQLRKDDSGCVSLRVILFPISSPTHSHNNSRSFLGACAGPARGEIARHLGELTLGSRLGASMRSPMVAQRWKLFAQSLLPTVALPPQSSTSPTGIVHMTDSEGDAIDWARAPEARDTEATGGVGWRMAPTAKRTAGLCCPLIHSSQALSRDTHFSRARDDYAFGTCRWRASNTQQPSHCICRAL